MLNAGKINEGLRGINVAVMKQRKRQEMKKENKECSEEEVKKRSKEEEKENMKKKRLRMKIEKDDL